LRFFSYGPSPTCVSSCETDLLERWYGDDVMVV